MTAATTTSTGAAASPAAGSTVIAKPKVETGRPRLLSKAEMLAPPTGPTQSNVDKFTAINCADADTMCQYFLKSFIFALKDE